MNITFISVVIALFIGTVEALQLIINGFGLKGHFYRIISDIDFGSLGYLIIFTFIISWVLSIVLYKIRKYDSLI